MAWKRSLKQTVASGELVCGFEVMSCSPILVEMVGYCGFDFVFIDTEHVPIGSDLDLVHLIRAAEASHAMPIVRVKENSEPCIRGALEAGAQGVIVPHVRTKEDAEQAVRHARYPLKGRRGTSSCVRAARYQCGDFSLQEYVRHSNDETMLIALFEDRECILNLDSILQVDGIDAYCFGPLDYAMTLGIDLTTDAKNTRVLEAFGRILEAARQKRVPMLSAVIPATAERSRQLMEMGVNFQLFGTDLDLLSASLNTIVKGTLADARRK